MTDVGQRQMIGILGSLGASHEALTLCLSARKPLSLVPLARGRQIWEREFCFPKTSDLPSEECG